VTGALNRSGGVSWRGPCSAPALSLVLLALGGIASAQPGLQPQIDQLIPSSIVAGSPDFTLVITGNNLTPAGRVEWRTAGTCGDPTGFRELEIISTGQRAIETTVTADLITAAGTVTICVVKNPGGERVPLTDSALFTIVAPLPAVCDINVVPLVLAFGSVEVGQTATLSVNVGNTGTATCTVNSLQVSGTGFSLGAGAPTVPFQVAPAAKVTVPVNFVPPTAGNHAGALTIGNDDPDEGVVSVQLSGMTMGSSPPVPPPSLLSITCHLSATTVGVASSGNLSVSGGKGPYIWELIGGAAELSDEALSFSSFGGAAKVTGCPTAEGTVGFTVRVTDSSFPKQSATQGCSLQIKPLVPPVGVGAVTRSRTRIDVSWTDPNPASGTCASRQFSVERCQLLNGSCESLTMPESHGVGQISQPTTPADSSCDANLCDSNLPDIGEPVTYRYEVKATFGGASSGPSFATATTLVVAPEPPRDPTLSVPYSASVTTGGGASPYAWDGTWEVWNGTWQPCDAEACRKGLTFDSQGRISGLPVEIGQLRLTARVTDANGATDARQFEITIGEGAFELSPGNGLDFGRVTADSTSSPKLITVKSVGEGHPLAAGKMSVGPESAYVIKENGCPELLLPGDSCDIGLVFSPGRLGRFNDSLTIPVNTVQKEKKVPLTGVGTVRSVTFEVKQEGMEVPAGAVVDPSSQPTVQLHLDREYAEKLRVILKASFEPGEVSNPTESGQDGCPGAECCLPSGEPIYQEVRFVQTGKVSQELDVGEEARFVAGTVAGRIRIDSKVVTTHPNPNQSMCLHLKAIRSRSR
jgi:hypothetical protein